MVELTPEASPKDIEVLMEQARKAGDLLKALSHESRLLILCILVSGEKSVSQLEDIMNMPQAAVSQQLARLRFDRLVKTRREGRMVYYSIADEEVTRLVELLYEFFCKPAEEASRSE
ncbi:MAG: metalloregulator ArsR/SmtB family transcription factor [Kiloniellaceae bacterium]